MHDHIAQKLIQMAAHDLQVRERLAKANKLEGGYAPEMEQVHRKNAMQLHEIIAKIGFPTISKVGIDAYTAAWLIVQHAIAEPDFMVRSYALMRRHIQDVSPAHLAYLYDRIQFFRGKPQRFGTQRNSDGTVYPVRNKRQLNAWRRKSLLPELSTAEINAILPVSELVRIHDQDSTYVKWRKDVGWS
ncbi:DUF6624 domain-containing protein [Sphingobacterium suaedae]|uniref:DUF6624 domain-containing protein n=1 Tax=Sphingobacterium suaedae TaxID=1686402 RepID=A0ABW5KE01_9SPHI